MAFNIVLVEPEIPPNTGNVGRLCAATNSTLHLVEPLGFELSDKHLKRAGLDYWPEIELTTHASWDAFLAATGALPEQLWFFSTRASATMYDAEFKDGDYLVFGSESKGLSAYFHDNYAARRIKIPFENEAVRSINLSTAVGIALYEARRRFS